MIPLNKKGDHWAIIINDKKEATSEQEIADFKRYQTLLCNYSIFKFVATIIHDNDKDQNGIYKRMHLHAFMDTDKMSAKQMLNHLTELLGIEEDQISIEASNNCYLGVQYLIHKNAPEKAQYEAKNIITNNNEELEKRLGQKYLTEEEQITEALNTSTTMKVLIDKIGVDKANKFRGLFKDLRAESSSIISQTYDKLRIGFIDLMEALMENIKLFDQITDMEERLRVLRIIENDVVLYKELLGIEK